MPSYNTICWTAVLLKGFYFNSFLATEYSLSSAKEIVFSSLRMIPDCTLVGIQEKSITWWLQKGSGFQSYLQLWLIHGTLMYPISFAQLPSKILLYPPPS